MVNFDLLMENIIGDENKKKKFISSALGLFLLSFVAVLLHEGTLKTILSLTVAVGQLTLFIWFISKIIKYALNKSKDENNK